MEKLKAFLKAKKRIRSRQSAMASMPWGHGPGPVLLLLIGTIINTIGTQFHIPS